MQDSTSSSLLQRAETGESDAWDRLDLLYRPLVRYWCQRGGVPEGEVDDVIQEVFSAILDNLAQFKHEAGPFRAWVRGITRHKIIDWFRARARHPEAIGGSDAYRWLQQLEDSSGDQVENDVEQTKLVSSGLRLLRDQFEDRTWLAFWRTAVDGRSCRELSEELDMTPGAIRVAKARVLRRLREEFADLLS